MAGLEHIETAARKKLGAAEGWRWFKCESVSGGWIIEGCVPDGTYSRGPRKGRPKFKAPGDRVVVSEDDVAVQEALYVQATGNCHQCLGTAKQIRSWSKAEGTKHDPCAKCNGTGKANPV